MKKLLIALAAVFITAASYGQGQLVFNTKVGTTVDAPVLIAGTQNGPGPTFTAQLYLSSGGSLTALTPATVFRAPQAGAGAIANRYVQPVDITVPGVASGANATLVMRAWETAKYANADAAKTGGELGESAPITIALGGGLLTPANLVGLQGFSIPVIPEPSVIALAVLGASALLLRRRK